MVKRFRIKDEALKRYWQKKREDNINNIKEKD